MANRVVLGLGGTVDYEVEWDSSVLESLVEKYGIVRAEIDTSVVVEDERDLVRSILGFVAAGAGGERFVASSQVLELFSARFPRRITLGGTSVRAALAMDRVGVASTVHLVSINDHVRELLPDRVSYVCSADEDSVEPHLIIQFPSGAHVRVVDGIVRAPQANRLIYVNDPPNQELVLSPELGKLMREARVVLLSGLNTVRDQQVMAERLAELTGHVQAMPDEALVVFEDAGYHVPAMTQLVRSAFAGIVDAWGMNEDEMQAYVNRPVDLHDPEDLEDALRSLREAVPTDLLIVHTKHWSLAFGASAVRWRDAVAAGVCMASARYLYGDGMTAEHVDAVRGERVDPTGVVIAEALERRLGAEAAVVPAFVLSSPHPTTIGLGDTFVGGLLAELASTPPAGT